jgi:hypothetical protein
MSRRAFNMITAGLVVVGIGYLVAVAARSLPGQEEEEPLVDIGFRFPEGVQNSIVWMMIAFAALGAALLILSVRRGNPGKAPPLRTLYTLATWLVILLVIYRYGVPAIEEAGEISSELGDEGPAAAEPGGSPTATAAAWIVSAVISAAIAAALIRLATIARATDWSFDRSQPSGVVLAAAAHRATPPVRLEGDDPRARVINAYADFETDARSAGIGRRQSETPRRHALRVQTELDVPGEDVADLSSSYERARFAESDVTAALAERAESAWMRLRARIVP